MRGISHQNRVSHRPGVALEAQLVAVLPQPGALLAMGGAGLRHQRPEARRVVRLLQMSELVDHHVIEHGQGRQEQAPVEVERSLT